MCLVNAFTSQLNGKLVVRRHDPGTEFILTFPRPGGQDGPVSGTV